MALIVNLIYLLVFIYYSYVYVMQDRSETVRLAFDDEKRKMTITGLEAFLILNIATGLMGLLPILAIHLLVMEIFCLFAIRKAPFDLPLTIPMKLFVVFIIWAFIGIFYTPMPVYGIRMILKLVFPLLMCILSMRVVRDKEVFYKSGQIGRIMGILSFIVTMIPMGGYIFLDVFWNKAALATNYTVWVILSLSLAYEGISSKKNVIWSIVFLLPCIIWVHRTNIFENVIALSAFFFIKYRVKSIPLIAGMACLAIAALFYIPSVKAKMYFRPDEVTLEDFLTNNVDENNINTSGRKYVWDDIEDWFYKGHEIVGSGTGRVQTYFYEEAVGWRRGGQLHNDLLVLRADNGLVGLGLYIVSYLAIMFHCLYIYHHSNYKSVRVCALTAGASLIGMLVTLYSDNTISYSMCTLAYPWVFYGMAVGLSRSENEII